MKLFSDVKLPLGETKTESAKPHVDASVAFLLIPSSSSSRLVELSDESVIDQIIFFDYSREITVITVETSSIEWLVKSFVFSSSLI